MNDIKEIIRKMDLLHKELSYLADEIVKQKPLKVGDFVLYRRPSGIKKDSPIKSPAFVGFVSGRIAWIYAMDNFVENFNWKDHKSIKRIDVVYDYDNYVVVSEEQVEKEYVRINQKSWRI